MRSASLCKLLGCRIGCDRSRQRSMQPSANAAIGQCYYLTIRLNVLGRGKMIQYIAMGGAALLSAVLVAASRKPDTLQVQRTTNIKALPEKIFPYINDFHTWTTWSPYENKDSAMKKTYSGTEKGKGAVYEGDDNDKVGSGRMEIIDVCEPSKVVIKLDFYKPFEGHNMAEFTLEAAGDVTKVTWGMHGPNKFFTKVMQTFLDMDKMIGTDFAVGLSNLKAIAEK